MRKLKPSADIWEVFPNLSVSIISSFIAIFGFCALETQLTMTPVQPLVLDYKRRLAVVRVCVSRLRSGKKKKGLKTKKDRKFINSSVRHLSAERRRQDAGDPAGTSCFSQPTLSLFVYFSSQGSQRVYAVKTDSMGTPTRAADTGARRGSPSLKNWRNFTDRKKKKI